MIRKDSAGKKVVRYTLLGMSIVFLVVGLIFMSVGVGFGAREQAVRSRCTESAVGTVVELKANGKEQYLPIVEFQTPTRRARVSTGIYQSPVPFVVGEQVDIRYNPDRTKEFYIVGYQGVKLFARIFEIAGGAFLLVGGVMLTIFIILNLRNKEQQNQAQLCQAPCEESRL